MNIGGDRGHFRSPNINIGGAMAPPDVRLCLIVLCNTRLNLWHCSRQAVFVASKLIKDSYKSLIVLCYTFAEFVALFEASKFIKETYKSLMVVCYTFAKFVALFEASKFIKLRLD